MKQKTVLTLLLLCVFLSVKAQKYGWKVGLDYFFDNTEFSKSSHTDSETMNGIWLQTQGEINWESRHAIRAGVNLLKIPGMNKAIDKVDVTAYYQYQTDNILFRAGAFPRKEVLGNYNNFFFKDSVQNFVPQMQGVFFQLGNSRNFFNAWFDRTGYATPTKREHFFVGLSGKATKGIFFADFQSYMFHYSNTKPSTPGWGVAENLQMHASLGANFEHGEYFRSLVSVGVLAGYERDRRFENQLYKPIGITSRIDLEYAGMGVNNTLYFGNKRQRLANAFGGDLYWGAPFLREKSYIESKWFVRLIESERVKAKFGCTLHFSEKNVLFEQMLTVSASIGNLQKNSSRKVVYPWTKIFNRK